MSEFGLILLALVGILVIVTGLPSYAILLFAALVGGIAAVASETVPIAVLSALPGRIVALLEHDLLQALPLYVLAGVLIDRMGVAPALFRLICWLLPRRPAAPLVAGLGLGALLGPMNGSVGASVLALSRSVAPRLEAAGVPPPDRQALIATAATMGVVIPPSLVLILLGDAMLTAHTLAINATRDTDRVINTQDVLRGALVPAALFLCLAMMAAWLSARNRSGRVQSVAERPSAAETVLALVSLTALVGLLGGVAAGVFYAVEAAATATFALFVAGLLIRRITLAGLAEMLAQVMVTTGALFAPLLAATTFTLVLRVLGTDKLVAGWIASLPGGDAAAVLVILLAIAVAALVLDAFEIIFVVIPIVVPPLLMRVPDAGWVAALVLLTLQASFLLPPAGYALMMARSTLGGEASLGAVAKALLPYLAAQAIVLGLVLAEPRLVHLLDPPGSRTRAGPDSQLAPADIDKALRSLPAPALGGMPGGLGPPNLPSLAPARPAP